MKNYRAYIKKGDETASRLFATVDEALNFVRPFIISGFKITISEAKRSPLFANKNNNHAT